MHHPQLYLGLIGFDLQDRLLIADFLRVNAGQARQASQFADTVSHPVWEIVDYREADALMINGSAVSHMQADNLHFSTASTLHNAPLAVSLSELQAPCAIRDAPALEGLLLPSSCLADAELLDPTHLLQCIQRFETVLRPLRSIFALAAELTERRHELDEQRCFHVEHEGTLDAIIDIPQSRVKVRPGVRPMDIEMGIWNMRPRNANFAPPDFLVCHLEEVAWLFAMHTPEFELPARYMVKPMYLRRPPRVRPSMLYRRHGYLLDCLAQAPANLAQIKEIVIPTQVPESPGMDERRIERDLFALYLCRAITTQPTKETMSSLTMGKRDELAHLNMADIHSRLHPFTRGTARLDTMAAEL